LLTQNTGSSPLTLPKEKTPPFGEVFSLVELQGLEPWTSSMPWKRSSQLSYSPKFISQNYFTKKLIAEQVATNYRARPPGGV
jgi:hypothetical protein